MAARIFLGLSGALWACYGVYCLVRPASLATLAGVAANATTGTVELRAMYGGLQAAIGAWALLGAFRPAFTRAALWTTVFLCTGLGSARLVGTIAAGELSSYTGQALAFELGSTLVAILLLRRSPPALPGSRL